MSRSKQRPQRSRKQRVHERAQERTPVAGRNDRQKDYPKETRRRLPLGSRLDRYVASYFVSSYTTAMLMMTGLFLVMDMAGNLDDFLERWPDGSSAPLGVLLRFYVLTLPLLYLQIAPFVTLLAGMFTVNRLLRTNEVTGVLAAGISAHRMILPVLFCGIVMGGAMFGLREVVGSGLSSQRDSLRYILEEQTFDVAFEDIAATDLTNSPMLVDVFRPHPVGGGPPEVEGMKVITRLGRTGGLPEYTRREADAAHWNGQNWDLINGWLSRIASGHEVLAQKEPIDELRGYKFSPEILMMYRRAKLEPLELSFREVNELIRREPDDLSYQTLWHYHLTFPLANLILLLVGLPLMFTYERGRGTERMALGGLLCVFYYAFDFVLRTLGMSGGFSPVLAAWIPVLVFGSLGVVLFDSMRS